MAKQIFSIKKEVHIKNKILEGYVFLHAGSNAKEIIIFLSNFIISYDFVGFRICLSIIAHP